MPVSEMVVTSVSQSDAFADVSWPGGTPVSQDSDIEACARVLNPAEKYVGGWTCNLIAAGAF